MAKLDFGKIMSQPTLEGKVNALELEIARIGGIDKVEITDVLVNTGFHHGIVTQYLAAEEDDALKRGEPHKWRLRVLRDEWGDQPPQVTRVERSIQRPLRGSNKAKLSNQQVQELKRRGEFNRRYVDHRVWTLDKDGCFECVFADAIWFLSEHGVNYEGRSPLCGRRELSSGPVRAPDGQMRHVWWWRYEEAPKDAPAQTPTRARKE